MQDFKPIVNFVGLGSREPWIWPNQWYTQQIYLWYFFDDLFIYFVAAFALFGTSEELVRDLQNL